MNIESVNQVETSSLQMKAIKAAKEALAEFNENAEAVSRGNLDPAALVSLREQSIRYSINLKLVKVSDEMIGQVLDTLA